MRASSASGATSSVANPCSRAQCGVARLAAQQQLARGGLAEHLRQQQRAGVARHQADADLGRHQQHAVGAEAQVAAGGELERAAHAHAVDGRDRRHRRRQHHPGQALEALHRRRPGGRVGLERRRAGRRPPRSARRRRAARCSARSGSAPAASIASAIAVMVVQVPGVAARLAVPGDHAAAAEVGGGDCHVAVSLLRVSTASRQRVAARGSVDDSGLVLGHGQRAGLQPRDGEARAQRRVQPVRHAAQVDLRRRLDVHAQRRDDRVALGHHAVAPQPRVGRPGSRRSPAGRRSRPARAACRRGGRRSGCAARARPHAHGEVHTCARSPER